MSQFKVLKNLPETAQLASALNRRSFLRRTGLAAVSLTPVVGLLFSGEKASAEYTTGITDIDVLNFALNLEYLEAEYYLYATTGMGLEGTSVAITGKGTQGTTTIKDSPLVPFTDPYIKQYAEEVTRDELAHVKFLREKLGNNTIARPPLDLLNSFNTLAMAAGIGSSFDPFASEINFLLGSFIFEDVGVTAYHGALASLINGATLTEAAGIMGTEAYHASLVRATLFDEDSENPSAGIAATVAKISSLRGQLGGGEDEPIVVNDRANIVPTDTRALVYARPAREVLNIVYGAVNATEGLFYPMGIN